MRRYSGNASSIGTGTHLEKHYIHRGSGNSKRQSRYKCKHFCKATGLCGVLGITCVGPSNQLCKNYWNKKNRGEEKNKEQSAKTQNPLGEGVLVYDAKCGLGSIIMAKTPYYLVEYYADKSVKQYNRDEIIELKNNFLFKKMKNWEI